MQKKGLIMIKAIVSNGVIIPRDPFPEDWDEGTEVAVEKCAGEGAANQSLDAADVWMDEVEAIARQGDPEDDQRLDNAIQEVRRRERQCCAIYRITVTDVNAVPLRDSCRLGGGP
jgi:hypothetical protein